MMDSAYFKSEKYRRDLLYISIGLYVAAAFLPGSFDLSNTMCCIGLLFLIIGPCLFIGNGFFWIIGVFWLANPFLFIAWYYYHRKPKAAVICASISLACWAAFLPDFIREFEGVYLVYSLGLFSIITTLAGSINQLKIQRNLEALAYENES